MAEDQNWEALADAVTARRTAVGFPTMKSLAHAMGVTPKLVQEIENARRVSYRPATLLGLERALRWGPGSVQAVLEGGQPEELSVEPTPFQPSEFPTIDQATDIQLATELLHRLMTRRNAERPKLEGRIGRNVPDPDADA